VEGASTVAVLEVEEGTLLMDELNWLPAAMASVKKSCRLLLSSAAFAGTTGCICTCTMSLRGQCLCRDMDRKESHLLGVDVMLVYTQPQYQNDQER
jgi:hypothetical protein